MGPVVGSAVPTGRVGSADDEEVGESEEPQALRTSARALSTPRPARQGRERVMSELYVTGSSEATAVLVRDPGKGPRPPLRHPGKGLRSPRRDLDVILGAR